MPTDTKTLLAKHQPKPAKPFPVDQQLCQVRFSPDGKQLAGGTFEGTIRRWDSSGSALQELPVLKGHDGWVWRLAFHNDGKQLFSADTWGQLVCWSVADAKPVWQIKDAHDGWIRALAIARDGKSLATAGRDRTVRIRSVADGKSLKTFDAGDDCLALAFHPDGKSLIVGTLTGSIKHWDLDTGKLVRELDAKTMYRRDRIQDVGGVRCFAFNADGSMLFAGGSLPTTGAFVQGHLLHLAFDWKTGNVKQTFKGSSDNDGYILDLAWHADDFLIGVSSGQPGQGKLIYFRPEDPQPFFTSPIPNAHSLAIHPNGKRIVVSATNANSAGNGRQIGRGEYPANSSPLHVFELPG